MTNRSVALALSLACLASDAFADDPKLNRVPVSIKKPIPVGPVKAVPTTTATSSSATTANSAHDNGRHRRRCAPENRAQCHGQEQGALVNSGQLPDLVVGQPDFTHGGPPASVSATTVMPAQITGDPAGTVLLATDMNSGRVLVYQPLPTANGAAATRVIGQPNLTGHDDYGTGDQKTGLRGPDGVSLGGGKLAIADAGSQRLIIHNSVPTTGNAMPAVIIGKDLGGATCTATTFGFPSAVWTDGTRVVLAERKNSRVLIWKSIPTSSTQAPDVVLGQPNLTSCRFGAERNMMNSPEGVFSDGTDLYVADRDNARVLVFKSFLNKANGAPADLVIGKAGNAAADTLAAPQAVLVHDGALLVADSGHHRVLVWDSLPTRDGQPATQVLGYGSLTDAAAPPSAPTQATLDQPTGLTVTDDKLWVSDIHYQRILRFTLYP